MDSQDKHGSRPHHNPSSSELFSSAKLVAEAAKATFSHETDKVDKAKVAGAAENILGAVSHYGKFDDKGVGKYVDKAEDYLHKYHSSHSSTTSTTTTAAATQHPSSHSGGGDGKSESGGGYGDYVKMAQGFFK
ncbi:hypothetical protein HS088_TW22G00846 [Tripterygium wilfordii]|uniref:Nodulin-related protein 1 n=1 Tax=Tripterygium wilfordii TaxID=458696 RepID=A0A7J7BZ32_TRIWF|nr:hypothetical protein HS088_TW22G00846 [Tripterygium wilfordii]